MQFRLLALLLLLFATACSAEPVRLYRLRDANQGSSERAAYEHLEAAVALANDFLAHSAYAHGFPAEEAYFSMGLTDILLHLKGEGVVPIRIETSGWGDLRTSLGDGVHTTNQGFLTARRTDDEATGEGFADAAFLQLKLPDMAAVLLRQAATLREIQARGEFDYWLNYDLLGLNPQRGWMEGNVVDQRAYAVQTGFYRWMEQRDFVPEAVDMEESETVLLTTEEELETTLPTIEEELPVAPKELPAATKELPAAVEKPVEKSSLVLPPVTPPGGGNYPEPDFPEEN